MAVSLANEVLKETKESINQSQWKELFQIMIQIN